MKTLASPFFNSDLRRLKAIVERITYKEGWKIRVSFDSPTVIIEALVKDVTTGLPLVIGATASFSEYDDEDRILYTIWAEIRNMEVHEASEWFKVDGKAIYNEHDLYPERFKSS